MRLNKVSELIHNSTNHQNLDKAAVSVHFQEIIDLVKLHYLLRRNVKSICETCVLRFSAAMDLN
jgi:hypothetical protein